MSENSYGFGTASADLDVKDHEEYKSPTPFESFKQAINRPANVEESVTYEIAGRDGMTVTFSTELDYDLLDRYMNKHRNKRRQTVDALNLSTDIMILLHRGIEINGETVEDEEGPIQFRNPGFAGMFPNMHTTQAAMKWLFGSDSALIAVGTALLEDCGYSDLGVEKADNTP